MPFPANLRAAREAAGLSPQELATKIRVHRTTILRMETGAVRRIDPARIQELAEVLGTSLADLLEDAACLEEHVSQEVSA